MKKNILIIIGSLDGGGAEKVLVDILKFFDYTRFEVALCLFSKKGIYISEVPKQVRILPLYSNKNGFLAKIEHRLYRHFRISLFESFRIKRKVAKHYDSIISFLEGEPIKFHSYIASRTNRNISWVHTDLFKNYNTVGYSLSAKDELNAYQKMDEIVFVSNDAMIQFKRKFTLKANHRMIYNPIDKKSIIETSAINSVVKEKFTICTIGRLFEIKALDRFIRVARMIKNVGFDFDYWIIGEGPLKEELLKLRDKLDLTNNVHLLGFKNPPSSWLKASDIFVNTSIAEGFPLVVCEALCLGKPIVATRCTGTVEMLGNSEFGILTDHDDESIYQGIKKLIDNPNLMKFYQGKAYDRSIELFDITKTMSEIYTIL
jgi:glycosyltransferase involved in cell wall biosynthesis